MTGKDLRWEKRRKEFIPLIAETFAELGYRKATTVELAANCGVSEVILYRLWDGGKQAMFVDSIHYLYEKRMEQWNKAIQNATSAESRVDQLIQETGRNLGQNRLYRIVFVALTETADEDVKQALRRMYFDFHARLQNELTNYREQTADQDCLPIVETAWALLGWGAFMNIVKELDLFGGGTKGDKKINEIFPRIARAMLELKQS